MALKKQTIGQFGEDIALDYCLKRGYIFLARNIKTSYTEIDLILKLKNLYIFIEVKTRLGQSFGLAIDSLGQKKQKNFKRSIMYYCRKNRIDFNCIRGDFFAIQIDKRKKIANIKHIKDIV